MSEDVFPESLIIIKNESADYSWGDYESTAERMLYNIDRLSQFKSPIARGDAHLYKKLVEGKYVDSGVEGLGVVAYDDPKDPKSKAVMGVATFGIDKNNIVGAAVVGNVGKIKNTDDDTLLFALAEEASHIRDFLKIYNLEGKFRDMTEEEVQRTEVKARLHQLELYGELKKEGIKSPSHEALLWKLGKSKPVEFIRNALGLKGDPDKEQEREYKNVLKHLRNIGYEI